MENLSYDDLIDYATEVITEIRRRAYGEGYEQGKFDQRMDSAFNDVAKITNTVGINIGETEQEKRDRIVGQAKNDIERFKVRGINGDEVYEVTRSSYISEVLSRGDYATCYARFVVNKGKRTVVALMRGELSDTVYSRGIAKCAPGDCFNVHIGKAIALRRALDLEVPDEYLNAPQPTDVRVGDVVRFPTGQVPNNLYEVISLSDKWNLRLVKNMHSDHGVGLTAHVDDFIDTKIIDDSRE